MDISNLDEFQGLTPQMVREWLAKLDPVIKPSECPSDDITAVSELCGETLQALLREINPRLRSWPSREARAAHDGLWLVVVADDETGAIGRFRNDVPWFSFNADDEGKGGHILTEEDSFALYWPCDKYGSKVRWPTDTEGNML